MTFKKSSYCNGAATCVEVDLTGKDVVLVRNSKVTNTTLVFDSDEWADFIAGVKAGEFDL